MPYPPHIWTFEVKRAQLLYGLSAPPPRRKWALCSGDQSGRLTCSHEEDASTEDDVVLAAVEPPGTDAEPAEQEQDGAEDGEDAGGAHDAWAGREAGQRGW